VGLTGVRTQKLRTGAFAVLAVVVSGSCSDQTDGWASWRSYNGSSDSSQYSSLSQINLGNVAQLEIAWTFPTGEEVHRSGPIVIGDTMYVVANGGVAALDAATGEQRWFAPDSIAPYTRGLVYWQDEDGHDQRLLVVNGHSLRAIDACTGAPILSFGEGGGIDLRQGLGRDPETITRIASMTPGRIYENLIILGSAMGDDAYSPAPGDIRAYDVRSGELAWTFHTIPHPGEAGYETWPPDAWKTVGAANVWSLMSVDEERGIVYAPTGAPSYHFHGANRAGDNLYANSLIALDARTGERLWHFQAVHHDVWDYDLAMAPKLLTVVRDGETIAAVALATKHGFLFVFDRVTGEPLYPIEEHSVPQSDVPGEQTSPTQPFPVAIPAFATQALTAKDLSPFADPEETGPLAARIRQARNEGLFTPPSFRGSVNVPGSRGGANFGNGAVIPDAGLFYLAVIESPTIPALEARREPVSEQDLSSAQEVYSWACASCHGERGEGKLPLFPAVAGISGRMTSREFLTLVREGRGRMEAFPDLQEVQVAALESYLDQLDLNQQGGELEAEQPAAAEILREIQRYRSGYHHFFSEDGLLLGAPPWSTLVAYDLNQGTLLWRKPYGDAIPLAEKGITGTGSLFPTNSLTATAGGLLFSVTNDRKIRAWDRETGEVVWSADLPADPGAIPAIYEVKGHQYIVASATKSRPDPNGQSSARHAYVAFSLPRGTN